MGAPVKIAVTVPSDLYRAVEGARKLREMSRSAVVQDALRDWLWHQTHADVVRKYEEGYRRRPEKARDAAAALSTATKLLADNDSW